MSGGAKVVKSQAQKQTGHEGVTSANTPLTTTAQEGAPMADTGFYLTTRERR
jgi:hypothetical protein